MFKGEVGHNLANDKGCLALSIRKIMQAEKRRKRALNYIRANDFQPACITYTRSAALMQELRTAEKPIYTPYVILPLYYDDGSILMPT
jgi:hypothetical protein